MAGGSDHTLGLLRLATIRSDEIVLIIEEPDAAVRRFAAQFAIELRERRPRAADIDAASAVLIAIGDVEAENSLIRAARRQGIPVHVADRDVVSDFRLLEFLEKHPSAALAA